MHADLCAGPHTNFDVESAIKSNRELHDWFKKNGFDKFQPKLVEEYGLFFVEDLASLDDDEISRMVVDAKQNKLLNMVSASLCLLRVGFVFLCVYSESDAHDGTESSGEPKKIPENDQSSERDTGQRITATSAWRC